MNIDPTSLPGRTSTALHERERIRFDDRFSDPKYPNLGSLLSSLFFGNLRHIT